RARDKKLLPDEVQGGTFTITNPGGYGTFHGTPVISQPQAAILGTYAVVKRPWVIQDDMGEDVIAIRPIMNLTLTYDHRLADDANRRHRTTHHDATKAARHRGRTRAGEAQCRCHDEQGDGSHARMVGVVRLMPMPPGAYLLELGLVPYQEAWDLQRALAGA